MPYLIGAVGILGGIVILVLLSGIRYIPNTRIGIVEKRFSLSGSVKSGFIALNGEAGFQPKVLRGGLHYLPPLQYVVRMAPLVTIPQGKIGYEDCLNAVEETVKAWGGVDILFNNAGIVRRATVVELSEEDWDRVMAVNAKSMFLMCKYAIPYMEKAGGGSVINNASGWGLTGGARAAVYCASKGAVVNLTRAMALDHGPKNVRVNCIAPGDTDTSMLRNEAKQLGESEAAFLKDSAVRPLGRIARPEEIAAAVLYLASDAASFGAIDSAVPADSTLEPSKGSSKS